MNPTDNSYPLFPTKLPVVKVVGVSASGKSTLVQGLRRAGYDARPVSQEHSQVATLWKQFGPPKVLIYLDVDLATQQERRPDVSWNEAARRTELERLAHAAENAELRIDTTEMSPKNVLRVALLWLEQADIRLADGALPPVPATGSAHE